MVSLRTVECLQSFCNLVLKDESTQQGTYLPLAFLSVEGYVQPHLHGNLVFRRFHRVFFFLLVRVLLSLHLIQEKVSPLLYTSLGSPDAGSLLWNMWNFVLPQTPTWFWTWVVPDAEAASCILQEKMKKKKNLIKKTFFHRVTSWFADLMTEFKN